MNRRILSNPSLVLRQIADQRGAALVVALLMLLGLAAMAMAAVMISSTDFVVAGGQRQRTSALHVAEAGLAEAMHRLSQAPGTLVPINGTDVDISIADPSDPPDPNWTARIFLTDVNAAPPAGSASVFHTGTIQPAGAYLDYGSAGDPTDVITIRHKLRDFNGDGVPEVALYDPSTIPPENPISGWPIERITVPGHDGQSDRIIQADVIHFPLNPNVFAGLMAAGGVDLRGNVTVCGQNHRLETPAGTQIPNCSPAWEEPDGHLFGVMTTGGAVTTQGSTDLLGSPSPTSTDPANNFQSIAEALGLTDQEWAEVASNADFTSVPDGVPWEGLTILSGDTKISGGDGSGLLYVDGDLELSGDFTWKGLIFVEGQLKNTGNTWILGGVMARGGTYATAVDFGAGTPTILYSRAALVQSLTLAMDYVVLAWKEL